MSSNESESKTPWTRSVSSVLESLNADMEDGLSDSEVRVRRKQHGKNILRETQTEHWLSILLNQFQNLIIGLLIVASAVAFIFGEFIEGWAIVVVILINGGIGFVTELRAIRSMESLREMGGLTARVVREGEVEVIPAEELVPGDIVELDGGDIVSADIRLIGTSKLQVDESALTGESVPVEKLSEVVEDDTPLAERTNMVYKGTHVNRGSARGVVVATGMETELGEITDLVQTAEEERTPLEERLDVLGKKLIWVTLLIAVFVTGTGIMAGKEVVLMVETGIALAVAAIPEGLPIVATIALARGMWKMARKNALINKLSAVETLGSTTMILTDKTGTLTENEMTVRRYRLQGEDYFTEKDNQGELIFLHNDEPVSVEPGSILYRALTVGSLCNNASLAQEGRGVGDPMEVALLDVAQRASINRAKLLEDRPEVREDAFDTDSKMMATVHEDPEGYFMAVKGAPESVIQQSSSIETKEGPQSFSESDKEDWLEQNQSLANQGLRLLGLAYRSAESSEENPYEEMVFLGLVALLDPPREDVREAIKTCHTAGIQVTMVTGDQAGTAKNIAREVGLVQGESPVLSGPDLEALDFTEPEDRDRVLRTKIFSRVSPAQKLDLVQLNQEKGHVVGMTGDGVNDAPALKKADIGIAMGMRGTQVAREAADMVLKDDAFSSIVSAVEQGRVIFKNIRKFVFYLLSCNISEILVVGMASGLRMPLPILPLQILFLNLVTDVFPALALGMGDGDPHIMKDPPRDPQEPVLEWNHWLSMFLYGTVFTLTVLGSLGVALYGLGFSAGRSITVSFLTLALAQLWHVFNMRDFGSGVFDNDIVKNRYVWGALGLCVGLLLLAVYVPTLSAVLKLTDPGVSGWGVSVGFSLIPFLFGQIIKGLRIQLDSFSGPRE